MRDLIQVGVSRVETRLDHLRRDMEELANKFALYLAHYPVKTRVSRHGLLGPVAEVVRLSAKPLMTAGQAAGRALRMHEMAQDGRRVSQQTTQALEEAVSTCFALMARCPVHLRKTVSDRVLDQVYFLSRKGEQEFWADWNNWLRSTYQKVDTLNNAWGTSFESWEKVRHSKSIDRAQADFRQFTDARKTAGKAVPEADQIDED